MPLPIYQQHLLTHLAVPPGLIAINVLCIDLLLSIKNTARSEWYILICIYCIYWYILFLCTFTHTHKYARLKQTLPNDGDSLPSSNPESRSLSRFLCLCPRCLWRRWLFLPPSGTWTPMNKVLWPTEQNAGRKFTGKLDEHLGFSTEIILMLHYTRVNGAP